MFVAASKDMKAAGETARAVLLLVVQTRSVRRVYVFVILVSKVTDTTAQMLMSVQLQQQTNVTLMPCVPMWKAPISVAVLEDFLEMVKYVQTSMNVSVLKVTSVTPTLCVPTLKDPMSVDVSKTLREMGKTVQRNQNATLLVLATRFARIIAAFQNVCVQMVFMVKTFA